MKLMAATQSSQVPSELHHQFCSIVALHICCFPQNSKVVFTAFLLYRLLNMDLSLSYLQFYELLLWLKERLESFLDNNEVQYNYKFRFKKYEDIAGAILDVLATIQDSIDKKRRTAAIFIGQQ
jgi:hypothetical protein